jgi:hypothetical protein
MKEGVDLERFRPAVYDEVLAGWQPLEEDSSFDLSKDNVRRVLSLTSGPWVATPLGMLLLKSSHDFPGQVDAKLLTPPGPPGSLAGPQEDGYFQIGIIGTKTEVAADAIHL